MCFFYPSFSCVHLSNYRYFSCIHLYKTKDYSLTFSQSLGKCKVLIRRFSDPAVSVRMLDLLFYFCIWFLPVQNACGGLLSFRPLTGGWPLCTEIRTIFHSEPYHPYEPFELNRSWSYGKWNNFSFYHFAAAILPHAKSKFYAAGAKSSGEGFNLKYRVRYYKRHSTV